jgi:hypothetical protein
MKRFVEGDDRKQVALLPECIDDYIGQNNPARISSNFMRNLRRSTGTGLSSTAQTAAPLRPVCATPPNRMLS